MKTDLWKQIAVWCLRIVYAAWLIFGAWNFWLQHRHEPHIFTGTILPGLAACLALVTAIWLWQKWPVIAATLAFLVLFFGVAAAIGITVNTLPPDDFSWDDIGMILVIAWLPLMGLGWLIWSTRKIRKQP